MYSYISLYVLTWTHGCAPNKIMRVWILRNKLSRINFIETSQTFMCPDSGTQH